MVAVFSEYFYMLSFNLFVISYIAYYKIGRFIFLSIPIPVFIPLDRSVKAFLQPAELLINLGFYFKAESPQAGDEKVLRLFFSF